MNSIIKVLSGIGLLIAVGLVVWNWQATVAIINSLGSTTIKGISTLQGKA